MRRRTSRVLLAGALLLAVTVAACSGVSHLSGLQPPSLGSVVRLETAPPPTRVPAPDPQLGIDIDFYAWPGMDVVPTAKKDIAYIRSLHANAVSLTFPFFMNGSRSSKVLATSATPSPGDLAAVARVAEHAGLYVSIRPLLDENSIGMGRVRWKPARPAAWFASYRRFLLPYAKMAQANHIPELVTGAELSRITDSPYYTKLDAALRRVYGGTLSYANNWGGRHTKTTNAAGVTLTVDAYRPLQLAASASLAQVQAAWDAYGRTLPHGVILSEVGIPAQPGAYAAPYRWILKGKPLMPAIQSRWFTAACHAVADDHMGGIYFWSLGFGQQFSQPPTAENPAAFVDGPGAAAISACFKSLSGAAG